MFATTDKTKKIRNNKWISTAWQNGDKRLRFSAVIGPFKFLSWITATFNACMFRLKTPRPFLEVFSSWTEEQDLDGLQLNLVKSNVLSFCFLRLITFSVYSLIFKCLHCTSVIFYEHPFSSNGNWLFLWKLAPRFPQIVAHQLTNPIMSSISFSTLKCFEVTHEKRLFTYNKTPTRGGGLMRCPGLLWMSLQWHLFFILFRSINILIFSSNNSLYIIFSNYCLFLCSLFLSFHSFIKFSPPARALAFEVLALKMWRAKQKGKQ